MSGQLLRLPRPSAKLWPFGDTKENILAVVDLGAHKMACALLAVRFARPQSGFGPKDVKVLSHAVVRSTGFASGTIVNLLAAETSLRRVVAKVEAQSGLTVEKINITGTFAGLSSQMFEARLANGPAGWSDEDLLAINAAAKESCAASARELLHVFASPSAGKDYDDGGTSGYGQNGAQSSAVDVLSISMPLRGARQIGACLKRSLLQPQDIIAGPIASALAVTNKEERHRGVLVIDLGARSTGIALYYANAPVFVDVIAYGSQDITEEIGKAFRLKKFEAEQLKIRHGGILDDLQADVDLPYVHGDTGDPISKFALHRLVRERVGEIFRAVNERLKDCGYSTVDLNTTLTGGGSLLSGIRELGSHVLATNVRIGRVASFYGLGGDNMFSALVGACAYACEQKLPRERADAHIMPPEEGGYVARISQWLRASF